jgi:hypothetical protein
MKQTLLSLALAMLCLVSSAQLKLSELYVNPQESKGHHEYFELYNNTGAPEELNCYSLVTFFSNGDDEAGFYVLDLPEMTIPVGGTFVGAAASPFSYQSKPTGGGTTTQANADFNWNQPGSSARLLRYTVNQTGTGYTTEVVPPTTDPAEIVNNLFEESPAFNRPNNNPQIYAVLLFKNGSLVQSFIPVTTGGGIPILPEHFTVPELVVEPFNGCSGFTIDFQALAPTLIASLQTGIGNPGPDNGFFFDFCENEWELSSAPNENTPGVAVASTITEELVEQLTFATNVLAECETDPRVITVNVGTDPLSPLPSNLIGTSATINLYVDNGDGILGPEDELVDSDNIDELPGTVVFEDTEDRTGEVVYLVQVVYNAVCHSIVVTTPPCLVTPVTFVSFTANRTKTNVNLNWITAVEQGNKGFNVQRKLGGGNWETVAFVPSKATEGNSNANLYYTYVEVNNYSGISQYRLEQVDIDGDIDYSDVRSVNGNVQGSKVIVYPNPSVTGKVNVAFSDLTVRDLMLNDMSGRLIKQWKGYRNNTLFIENLKAGVYTLRIVDANGTSTTEKIVISK